MSPTDRTPEPTGELDAFVAAFEAAYARDGRADPAAFLPSPDHPLYRRILQELLRVDLEFAWDRGESRRVEAYRDQFPELFSDPEGLRAVAWEEFRLRQAAGESPTIAEYRQRLGIDLPRAAPESSPTGLLATHELPDGTPVIGEDTLPASVSAMPQPGNLVAGFVLLTELGRGAFGRVFLAREPGLAARLVVLKVSSKLPGEAQTLARLQHTNIVPIYSVHRHGPFHVICMPYLGATTLADLLDEFRGSSRLPTSGKGVISTLADRANRTHLAAGPAGSGTHRTPPDRAPLGGTTRVGIDRLERMTYTETVLWLGVQLADGLAHAHERGILHRDLKPANVLLADDGRPLLLDFNLAVDEADPAGDAAAGGTLRYMAPEVIAALTVHRGHADVRADIYGLGLILYELLTSQFPFPDVPAGKSWEDILPQIRADRLSPPPDASTLGRDISPAVGSILATCLAPDPAKRYPSAAALRDDLQRQLDHRPLKFAPNPSIRERVRKWARRHPRLASSAVLGTVASVIVLALGAALVARQRTIDREIAARVAAQEESERQEAAVIRIQLQTERQSLGLLVGGEIPPHMASDAVRRARGILSPYNALGESDWTNGPLITRLPEADQAAARLDVASVLLQLAMGRYAEARHELDPDRRHPLLNEAFQANQSAARLAVPEITLRARYQRIALLRLARRTAEADELDRLLREELSREPNQKAEELLGTGRYREAIPLLKPLTESRPAGYPIWLRLGFCYQMTGEHAEALRCFDVAAALAPPGDPSVTYRRGLALRDLNRFREAIAAFDLLLKRYPDDPVVLYQRGLCWYDLQEAAEAVTDFNRVEELRLPVSRLYFVRARVRKHLKDTAGAQADIEKGMKTEPLDPVDWIARGRIKLELRRYSEALDDFRKGVELDRYVSEGLANIAAVCADPDMLNRPHDAIEALTELLDRNPNDVVARAGRAVVLARVGKKAKALQDVAVCEQTTLAPVQQYQLACAYVLASNAPAHRARALHLLRECLRKEPGWAASMIDDKGNIDRDLHPIHNDPTFLEIVELAKTILQKQAALAGKN